MSASAADTVLALARPELVGRVAYKPPVVPSDMVRLHANESPWNAPGEEARGLNRYPSLAGLLETRMSEVYGVEADQVLATRGSNDALDLVIRAFCRAGVDAILTATPTFAMYAELAEVQGADVVAVAMDPERGFAFDADALLDAWTPAVKVVFVCSPNNPTGQVAAPEQLDRLLDRLAGRSLVVVDEAYAEFADGPSVVSRLREWPNLVVVRTLSKGYGLAGARCGALLARRDVVDLARSILPPYALPDPTARAALAALTPRAVETAAGRFERIRAERARLTGTLATLPGVQTVWPGEGNFLLLKTADREAFVRRCEQGGVLVRRLHGDAFLDQCVRITVGTAPENEALIAALAQPADEEA